MKKEIRILHLYADLLDLYGDGGNLMALAHVLKQNGHDCQIDTSSLYDRPDFSSYDMIYCGPGKLKNILAAIPEFIKQKDAFQKALEADIPILFCGNAMMLLAKNVQDADNNTYPSSGILQITMRDVNQITIKDVLSSCDLCDQEVLGFINRTYEILDDNEQHPLFRIQKGLKEKTEGFWIHNALITMQLGPILVRNPQLLSWYYQKLTGETPEISPTAQTVHDLTVSELH